MTFLVKVAAFALLLTSSFFVDRPEAGVDASVPLTVENLSKKWTLDKYKYFIFEEAPAKNEQGDYIHLKSDMTFDSVSEGNQGDGKWRLDSKAKRLYLSNEKDEEEALMFIIEDLSSNQLVLIIDDPSDADAKNLKMFFKA